MKYEKIADILKEQVKPALGCTEPVAVAIAVSTAYQQIKGNLEYAFIKLSPSIFKNGMRVGIPGTTQTGIPFAAALAVVCGRPDLGLEVFDAVTEKDVDIAKEMIALDKIQVAVEENKTKFYIEVIIKTDLGESKCIIQEYHTNVVFLGVNGKVVYQKPVELKVNNTKEIYNLGDLTVKELREIIENMPIEEIKFLAEGAKLNKQMALTGLKNRVGLALGAGMNDLIEKGVLKRDLVNQVRVYTAAATDARMSGVKLPVMSSAGSGNHGITAILPPVIVSEQFGLGEEKLIRALAFSHLVTIYIKEYTGKLSPVCGCSIAAGVGACASVAWLIGCDDKQIAGAIKNMVGNLSGMLCDGAKGGCAFKLSTASSEAIISAELAKNNIIISDFDGIVGDGVETTIKNLGKLCMEGMAEADGKIIEIMLAE